MNEPIRVTCVIDRYWDHTERKFVGTDADGDLLEISTQSELDEPDKIIPVGIVLLDDGALESVPVEFIRRA